MFSNSQHFESKFWFIPFRDNAKFIWTCFPFSSKRSFCPHNYFSRCPWSRNWFSSKKRFSHLFSSAEEFLLCSFLTGDQYLTSSVSKQPPIPTKFASSLTRYDTHKVHTAILSFSHLWGCLCPVNHLYGNVNMGTWMSSQFIIFISNSDSNSIYWKWGPNIYSAFFYI